MVKIVFFGTHDFGAAMLQALIGAGFEIPYVVTQPDRPVGREREAKASAVKTLAQQHGIEVLQPETLKGFELPGDHDLNVVCQYGLIIPRTILEKPKLKSINVHTSLLPKYRGASPIQSAIINGETETGVTIMLMDEKMDHGPILSQTKVTVEPNQTYPELETAMREPAAALLVATLKQLLNNELKPKMQDENSATYCKIFTREDGKIDWNKSAKQIYDLYRGLTPWPGVWTSLNGKRLKLLSISYENGSISPGMVEAKGDVIRIGTSSGAVVVNELQLEGKKALSAKDFLIGYRDFGGSKLA